MFQRVGRVVVCFGLCVGLAGCASAPKKELSAAEAALAASAAERECAPEKFAAAERLLSEARMLSQEGDYDEAKKKAVAARKMAEEARAVAARDAEKCAARNRAVAEAKPTDPAGKSKGPGELDAEAQLMTIYFAFDSADLTPAQRDHLDQNAEWLRQHDGATLRLEGHTDERGSEEYNIALGERRAESVRKYLVTLGLEPNRFSILSYGEEKPAAAGEGEDSFQQNRRVEFDPVSQ